MKIIIKGLWIPALAIGMIIAVPALGAADTPEPSTPKVEGEPGKVKPGATRMFPEVRAADNVASTEVPVYSPPKVETKPTRVKPGATRRLMPIAIPTPVVLAAEHTGYTIEAQPVLYWFIPKSVEGKITFTLTDLAKILNGAPLVEVKLDKAEAGVQAINLAEQGVSLEVDHEYEWNISVQGKDKSSPALVSIATIKRVVAEKEIVTQLKKNDESRHAFIYAEGGLWYDALNAVSKQIAQYPDNQTFHQQRAALLSQVGLEEAANYDLSF